MIGSANTQWKICSGKAHCLYAYGRQYFFFFLQFLLPSFPLISVWGLMWSFLVVLILGLWSATTRPCGCCIKSSLIQTRHNWGKYTSHLCIAGSFMILFSYFLIPGGCWFCVCIFNYIVNKTFGYFNYSIPPHPQKKTFRRSVFSNSYVNLMLQMVLGKQIRLFVIFPDFFFKFYNLT